MKTDKRQNKFQIFFLFLIITSVTYAEILTYPIVDTAQLDFYSHNALIDSPLPGEPFYGQDAHYVGHEPNYVDNGDGTVTDLVTGLMWQQTPVEKMTFEQAVDGAQTFTLADYNDWRLPTIKELYSLILFDGVDPGPEGQANDGHPYIDTDYFDFDYGDTMGGERIIDAQYWSATEYVWTTMNGNPTTFGVNFADGRIKGYPSVKPNGKKTTQFVRYVRGNLDYGQNQFIDNGDGTISDLATGLMWMKDDSQVALNWEEALAYAEDVNVADYNDWRLPNAKELHSILDYTRAPDTTDSAAIDPNFLCSEITNEGGKKDWPYYWSSTTHLANSPRPYSAGAYMCFGRSLGYMNNRWQDVHGAGAQRSDPKQGDPSKYPFGRGPQGDNIRIYNHVRCVRTMDVQAEETSTKMSPSQNVLLIIADDYGVSSHGLYGYAPRSAPTPNLDTLAAEGALFGSAWAAPMCSPTRATILTGRHGFRTGIGSPPGAIDLNEFTVAHALQDLGYSTGCFGKWHLSHRSNGGNDNPNLMGFDHYAGLKGNGAGTEDYYNWGKVVNGVTSDVNRYATTEITDDAIDWIQEQGEQPWFCWLAYNAAHSPFHKPPNDLHSYDDLSGGTGHIKKNTVLYYEAMVEAMDTEIGRLFSSMDPNVLKNTNIIFVGDNGTPGQAYLLDAQYRRLKGTLYQGGVWVPWIMKGPAIPQTDVMINGLVTTVDLFSTIIELAGSTAETIVPDDVIYDSRSVLPLLVNPGTGSIRDFAMTEQFHKTPDDKDGKAIRNDIYKLIRFDSGDESFYHLGSDPWEEIDLLESTLNEIEQVNYEELNKQLDQLLYSEIE